MTFSVIFCDDRRNNSFIMLPRWLKDGLAERGGAPTAGVWLDTPTRHSNGQPATATLPPRQKSPDLISYIVPHIQNMYERSAIK